ncbi:hypothetical protein F6X40_17025 [Paraburkholderia sp. UCT31]|uniref:hypothetical protein n=1 Tax=Paraburkholderia sp. UCT31 TaxID=2615209 RepID=UPI00165577E0|nr:hypothetical protein [Paraburkholderia sp. UCT31]MBC8738480.1 hypothetical protein [Paraburkholderia sp. UCT31]
MSKRNSMTTLFKKLLPVKRAPMDAVEPELAAQAIELGEAANRLTQREAPEFSIKNVDLADVVLEQPERDEEHIARVLELEPKETLSARIRRMRLRFAKPDTKSVEGTAEFLAYVQTNKPIRILIGFVSGVSLKDAEYFAVGVADKHCESPYITYLGVYPYQGGYAYEIHEGGHGRSYLQKILKYYEGLPPNIHEELTGVYIATSTRMVQVLKTPDGLVSVQLPESYKAVETDWLVQGLIPEKKLAPIAGTNTGLMVVAGVFLSVALMALIGAYATRYQPYEPPPPAVEDVVSYPDSPIGRWDMLLKRPADTYVTALRYDGKKWKTDTAVVPGAKHMPKPQQDEQTKRAAPEAAPTSGAQDRESASPAAKAVKNLQAAKVAGVQRPATPVPPHKSLPPATTSLTQPNQGLTQ